ncbi:MAG: FeoB-associated Cys-rich membrane protein [Ruminococcus sp.]|nr:FeoB-associated Cys-rich membrane protein [Ruminococcus sp.]
MGTVLTGLVLLGVVALIIGGMVKNKKSGKSSCGCGCEHCANSSVCHRKDGN